MRKTKAAILIPAIVATLIVLWFNTGHFLQTRSKRTARFVAAVNAGDDVTSLELLDAGIDSTAYTGNTVPETTWQHLEGTLFHVKAYYGGPSALTIITRHLNAAPDDRTGSDEWERLPMWLAQRLIIAGARVDFTDRQSSNTLLMFASMHHNVSLTKALIDHDADVNVQNRSGYGALALCNYGQIVTMLLEHGAAPNVIRSDGKTPLMDRAKVGDIENVTLLLDKGADIDRRDSSGDTALFFAVQPKPALQANQIQDIVRILLERHGNPNQRNNRGETPLMGCNDPTVIDLLLQHGADVDAIDLRGDTALITAAAHNQTEAVRALIAHHARADIKDRSGRTAADIAASNHRPDLVAMLATSC